MDQIGSKIGVRMASYTQEQRERALAFFSELGSATATVRRLGYLSRRRLYAWENATPPTGAPAT